MDGAIFTTEIKCREVVTRDPATHNWRTTYEAKASELWDAEWAHDASTFAARILVFVEFTRPSNVHDGNCHSHAWVPETHLHASIRWGGADWLTLFGWVGFPLSVAAQQAALLAAPKAAAKAAAKVAPAPPAPPAPAAVKVPWATVLAELGAPLTYLAVEVYPVKRFLTAMKVPSTNSGRWMTKWRNAVWMREYLQNNGGGAHFFEDTRRGCHQGGVMAKLVSVVALQRAWVRDPELQKPRP